MDGGSGSDSLKRLTPAMILPVALVALAVIVAAGVFKVIGLTTFGLAVLLLPPIGIALLIYYPKMLPLLLVILFVPVYVPGFAIGGLSLSELLIPILLFVYILQRMIHRSDYNRVRLYNVPFAMYLLLAMGIIWYIRSGDYLPHTQLLGSFRSYYTFFSCVALYFLLLSLLKDEKQIQQSLKVLFWIGLLSTFYFFVLIALHREGTPITTGGLTGGEWRIHFLGGGRLPVRCIAMSNIGLLLFLTSLAGEYPRNRMLRSFCIVMALGTMIAAGGRGVFTGSIVSLLVYLVMKRHYIVFSGTFAAGAATMAVIMLAPQVVESLPKPMQRAFSFRTLESSEAATSAESRFDVWKYAGEKIKERPLLGWGFRGIDISIIHALTRRQLFTLSSVETGSTHNSYLGYAYVFGIPGLLLFLILYATHFGRVWKLARIHPDPNVKGLALFLVLTLAARSLVFLIGGEGPKDTRFFIDIGLAQALWLLVLKYERQEDKAPVVTKAEAQPVLAAAGTK